MTVPLVTEQVALVTGASGAIGQAICRRLARRPVRVAVHYHRHEADANRIVEEVENAGGVAWAVAADLSTATAVQALVKTIVERWGRLDLLVNNAGAIRDALLLGMSDDEIEDVLTINLRSAIWLTRAAVPHMMSRRAGVVVNVSSLAASRPNRGQSNYVAAKAGLEGFTRAMSVELGPKGIRVNAVAPGLIESDMTVAVREQRGGDFVRQVPLRRVGLPDDIAGAVCFLLSAEASYITGHVLRVDGGRHVGGSA